MDQTTTDKSLIGRRSFLKTGAIVAAPLAAAAPVAALAGDGSRARLARLEDERAIEALQRAMLRRLSGADAGSLRAFAAHVGGAPLAGTVHAVLEDHAHELELEFAADGLSARARCHCRVEIEAAFEGDTTLERMARFEGRGSHRFAEERVLATEFVKGKDGWRIAGARLA